MPPCSDTDGPGVSVSVDSTITVSMRGTVAEDGRVGEDGRVRDTRSMSMLGPTVAFGPDNPATTHLNSSNS